MHNKMPHLKVEKTRPKQLLGYLPLAFTLPGYLHLQPTYIVSKYVSSQLHLGSTKNTSFWTNESIYSVLFYVHWKTDKASIAITLT
jgi:hypothetical protein